MYERRSRLITRQQSELICFFVAGATARAAGEIVGVHRNTATSYFMRLRRLIATHLPSYRLSGEVEARSLIRGICEKHQVEILKGHIAPDHIHLFVSIPPNLAVNKLMQQLQWQCDR